MATSDIRPPGESTSPSLCFDGVTFAVDGNTTVLVSGADKELVGNEAAKVRAIRPPEPYKGKGIRYADEHVRRKEAKKK